MPFCTTRSMRNKNIKNDISHKYEPNTKDCRINTNYFQNSKSHSSMLVAILQVYFTNTAYATINLFEYQPSYNCVNKHKNTE